MAFGFGVLEVERAAEGFEGVIVGLLELRERAGKLGGALFDELLEVALVGAVFHDQAAMLQGAADAEEELVFLKGLEDVVVSAAADGFQSGRNVVDGGDHDNGNFRIVLAEPIEEFDAVHLGHDHVAEDEIGGEALDLVLCGAAVADGSTLVTLGLEHRRNDFANGFFVVNYQYVFKVHDDWLPAVIIRDGTGGMGRACPVRKQRVSVMVKLVWRASRQSRCGSHY